LTTALGPAPDNIGSVGEKKVTLVYNRSWHP